MTDVVISGTGLYTPPYAISNEELVDSFNQYVTRWNLDHAAAIAAGEVEALAPSATEFIEKASGIRSRYVVDKMGILDPERMCPNLPERGNDEPSIQVEMALKAATQALAEAGCEAADIDLVIVACSNMQRPYPAMAVELQHHLGGRGYGFDMNVACSSATFGIKTGVDAIQSGSAQRVLMVNPEICTGHLNFRDRDSHFIFGDACTAVLLEAAHSVQAKNYFGIDAIKLETDYSNNIRNNFGFLNRTSPATTQSPDKLFVQQGRKVFKEVCPAVAQLIKAQLSEEGIEARDLKRLWLHQANQSMNDLIARKLLGCDPQPGQAPVILDEYANTSSAGSIIAFHKYKSDLVKGDRGVICSFGAGYSIGSVLVQCK